MFVREPVVVPEEDIDAEVEAGDVGILAIQT